MGFFVGRSLLKHKVARVKSGLPFYKFRTPRGESLLDVQKRVVAFYKRLTKTPKKETILLVSHQGPIVSLLLHLLKKPFDRYERYRMENTAITVISIDAKRKSRIHHLAKSDHLTETGLKEAKCIPPDKQWKNLLSIM